MKELKTTNKKTVMDCALLCDQIYDFMKDEETVGAKVREKGFEVLKSFNLKACDLQALIIQSEMSVYLVFEGTVSTLDWLHNLWMDMRSDNNGGHYHSGFAKLCEDSFSDIGEYLKSSDEVKKKGLIITGHSLGGALAMMYCRELKDYLKTFPIKMLVTFGQPRCGNSAFVRNFELLRIKYYRFVNAGDYIADVPTPWEKWEWSHCGTGIVCDNKKISPHSNEYENNLLYRIVKVAYSAIQLILAKNWNKESRGMLSSNHSMDLYCCNLEAALAVEEIIETKAIGVANA